MNFFKLYIGDYQRDTGCLSIAEHGVYFLMLQYHYATEKPLPTGKDLYRLLRCSTKADRDAVDVVAKQFWQESPGGLVNSRATKEMAEAHAYAEAQSTRAHKRWDKQKDMPAHMQVHEQAQCPIDASHSHSHIKTNTPPSGFAEFWMAYPRKVAKGAAEKTWRKLKPSPELIAVILDSLQVWDLPEAKFIPHPATWLNHRRWEDQPVEKRKGMVI